MMRRSVFSTFSLISHGKPLKINIFSSTSPFFSQQMNLSTKEGTGNINSFLESIDTTLTPEQQTYVNKLKKSYRGNTISPYTSPPLPKDIPADGTTLPLMAPNAEALIDYALSHIPKRTGPRRSREKRRHKQKMEQIESNHKRRIEQTKLATARKLENRRFHHILEAYYLDLAKNPSTIRGDSRYPSKDQLEQFKTTKYPEIKTKQMELFRTEIAEKKIKAAQRLAQKTAIKEQKYQERLKRMKSN